MNVFLFIGFCFLLIIFSHCVWNQYIKTWISPKKKTKDLVKTQTDKYKKMLDELASNTLQIHKQENSFLSPAEKYELEKELWDYVSTVES